MVECLLSMHKAMSCTYLYPNTHTCEQAIFKEINFSHLLYLLLLPIYNKLQQIQGLSQHSYISSQFVKVRHQCQVGWVLCSSSQVVSQCQEASGLLELAILEIHIVVGRIHFLAAVGFMETLSPRPAGHCTSLSFKKVQLIRSALPAIISIWINQIPTHQ